jgi:parallel beta-helix repeat protein
MRRLFFALLASAAIIAPAEAKRIALVIGNSNYDNVTDLVNPVNDANLMERSLAEAGFEVIKYNDLDQKGMKKAMLEFGRKLKEGADASMFFYAGHGVEVNGRNYLVPVDSNTKSKEEVDFQNVEVNDFLALMENSKVPLNIVVLDACRNNPFRGLRATGGGLAPVSAPAGTLVSYATASGAVAADGEGDNSPFTLALTETMKIPGLTLESVFKRTRTKVLATTAGEQLPYESSSLQGEDFYFTAAPKPEPAPEPAPEPVVETTPKTDLKADDRQIAVLPKKIEPVQEDSPVKSSGTNAQTEVPVSPGEAAFLAAGDDIELLKAIQLQYGDTIWGKLAAARVRVLTAQLALNTKKADDGGGAQALITPPADVTPPVVTPEPEPPPVVEVTPPTTSGAIVVAADGSGQYSSIVDAINAAKAGDRIEVKPGRYTGGIKLEKAVDIVGLGDKNSIIWSNTGGDVIHWRVNGGMVTNLTLMNEGGCSATCNAVFFDNTSGVLDNVNVTSQGNANIYVGGEFAKPTIKYSNIYDSREGGIFSDNKSEPTIEQNVIYGNTYAGIEIKNGSKPTIRNNDIKDGKEDGIYVNENGLGSIESNKIYGNKVAGIRIIKNGNSLIKNNLIYSSQSMGIYVTENGRGIIEYNDIYENTHGNVMSAKGGNPIIRNNKIFNGKEGGIFFFDKGMGTVENNEIYGNAFANVEVREGSDPVIRSNTIKEGKQGGILVNGGGLGLFESNDITANTLTGVEIKGNGSNPKFRNNRITGNKQQGVYVYEKGRATFESNDITGNTNGAFFIDKSAGKLRRSGNKT